jgi:DNA-binding MarR family transcriptional regulator
MRTMPEPEEQDHIDRFFVALAEQMPTLDLAVEGIVERIAGLARRFRKMLKETLEEYELTSGEWEVLGHLVRMRQRYSPGQLATKAELSTGAMTNRLDRLEQAGLVRRLPDPDDRRALEVEATDEGRRVYESSVDVQAAKEALIASALDEAEKEQLNALLRRLMLAFELHEGRKKAE